MTGEWRLAQAVSALHHGIQAMQAEDPDMDVETALPETVEGVDSAMRRIVRNCQDSQDIADAARKRASEASERARRYDARADRYRGLLLATMDALAWKKREWPEATVSMRAPQQGVFIIDETELPQGFVRISRTPDKSAIRTALKAGETVPGAVLTPGIPGIQIRGN